MQQVLDQVLAVLVDVARRDADPWRAGGDAATVASFVIRAKSSGRRTSWRPGS
jgi:hypothetical protein